MRALYQPQSYRSALSHLLAHINKPVAWVGTSLGGICGLMLAAADNTPITRMVLNDMGPHIPAAALARIRDYMSKGAGAISQHRRVGGAFAADPRAVRQAYRCAMGASRPLLRPPSAGGAYTLHYDPKIAEPIKASVPIDADMWPLWSLIKIPVLAIRGESERFADRRRP